MKAGTRSPTSLEVWEGSVQDLEQVDNEKKLKS